MILADLISGIDVRCDIKGADPSQIRICDLTEDSRTAVPGSLFIASIGTKDDGNRFIEPAIQCGCVAILTDRDNLELPNRSNIAVLITDDVKETGARLAERFYGDPSKKLIIAGITGTNGKTTIAHLAHQLIEAADIRCGLIGTVEIDDGRERARATMTTPPAVETSRTLATMVEHGCKAAVMEVSSHALDQSRVGAIGFDAAVFTNLTGDHLDYHHTLDAYRDSKAKLFSLLKPDATAVINVDDDASKAMIHACTDGARIVHCSMNELESDSTVRIIDESIEGMTLALDTPDGWIEARVPFFGSFNAMNTLQALLVAQCVLKKAGADTSTQTRVIAEELPKLALPAGRLEHVESDADDLSVLVDFAHTDDALGNALRSVKAVLPEQARLWCVFGCGGDRDTTKRPRMGKVVAQLADSLVITSDNPRTEAPNRIIEEIVSGVDVLSRDRLTIEPDRASAIAIAISSAAPGDAVLIAGKGHETEQISPDGAGGVRIAHFDDRQHARIALRERRLRRSVTGEPDTKVREA